MSESQKFGGPWTVQKLSAVENYLNSYTTALKNTPLKLCYIDAFSGAGYVTLKSGETIDGSAIRALRYPFDRYYFFEQDSECLNALREKIRMDFDDKKDKIELVQGDCNELLKNIDQASWFNKNWRGVIFLDPFAMDLSWSCLESISRTKAFDVWYLFPFSAVNRNLTTSGKILPANEAKLTKIFGSSDWKTIIYKESPQLTYLDEPNLAKASVEGLKQYILGRLQETFYGAVAPNPALLRNKMNSSLFLLCFAASNPNEQAKALALKLAKHILEKVSD